MLCALSEWNGKTFHLSRHFIFGGAILDLDIYIFPWQMCFIWAVVSDYSHLAFGYIRYIISLFTNPHHYNCVFISKEQCTWKGYWKNVKMKFIPDNNISTPNIGHEHTEKPLCVWSQCSLQPHQIWTHSICLWSHLPITEPHHGFLPLHQNLYPSHQTFSSVLHHPIQHKKSAVSFIQYTTWLRHCLAIWGGEFEIPLWRSLILWSYGLQYCIAQQVHINILEEDLPTIFWELWLWRQCSCEIAVHT